MKIADVVEILEQIAPPEYAEPWDNVGLLVGDAGRPCRRAVLCIDLTAEVLAEAGRAKAQLVMAYHPAIFKPITRVTAEAAPVVAAAARAGVAVYSVHTAFDSAVGGANDVLADALGISADRRPLAGRCAQGGYKVVVFVPPADLPVVSQAAFAAGAGHIGAYSQCGFSAAGRGTFFGGRDTRPVVGRPGRREEVQELRWEVICPRNSLPDVLAAVRAAHSYEAPAIDVYALTEAPTGVGLGRVGRLTRPAALATMLGKVRRACGVRRMQLTRPRRRNPRKIIRTLAVGCGSCGSLYEQAVAAGADLYVTGELRHHDALAAAAAGLTVACVGHSNSERLTLGSLARRLRAALPKLGVTLARADRDPFEIV